MRIPEHGPAEERTVRIELRFGVQRAARVIEIRQPRRVEPRELTRAELVEERRRRDAAFAQHPLAGRIGAGGFAAANAGLTGVRASAAAAPSATARNASSHRSR